MVEYILLVGNPITNSGEIRHKKVSADWELTAEIAHVTNLGDQKSVVYSIFELPLSGNNWLISARVKDNEGDVFDVTMVFPLRKQIASYEDFANLLAQVRSHRAFRQHRILYFIAVNKF